MLNNESSMQVYFRMFAVMCTLTSKGPIKLLKRFHFDFIRCLLCHDRQKRNIWLSFHFILFQTRGGLTLYSLKQFLGRLLLFQVYWSIFLGDTPAGKCGTHTPPPLI